MNKKPPKASGKHFMIDRALITRICDAGFLERNDVVLEVGAGSGNLTYELCKRCKFVYAVEKDRLLCEKLRTRLDNSCIINCEIINADALKIEYPIFNKVISNIPYAISRKFIIKLLSYNFELCTLVVQMEFAQKLMSCAGSKNYRLVSALTGSFCDVEILEAINRSAFEPMPEVESALIRITPLSFQMKKSEYNDYVKFLRNLFSQKNKLITNVLDKILNYKTKKNKISDKFTNLRVYELSPVEFIEIFNKIKDH